MTAVPSWHYSSPDGLTAEEYEALPEEVCRRIEVVDGKVILSPSPRRTHQLVADELRSVLQAAAKPRFVAVTDVDLRLRDVPLLIRKPDIVVFDSSLPDDVPLRPRHCLLAVEVMSPGSVTTDQVDKPAEYAAAGIEHFWRVENCDDIQKLTIFRFRLEPTTHTYALVGASTGSLAVNDPLEVSVDFADLF